MTRKRLRQFLRYVEPVRLGCWVWHGPRNAQGYARFANERREANVHRWAYCYFLGLFPGHLTLDHLCRVRQCVNPLHLEAVPIEENIRRGSSGLADARSSFLAQLMSRRSELYVGGPW